MQKLASFTMLQVGLDLVPWSNRMVMKSQYTLMAVKMTMMVPVGVDSVEPDHVVSHWLKVGLTTNLQLLMIYFIQKTVLKFLL